MYPTSIFEKINSSSVDNLYLCNNKFFCKKNKNTGKKESIKYVSLLYKKDLSSDRNNLNLLSHLNKRTANLAESYVDCNKKVDYSPQSRLMIGTGGESPYSGILLMTLHQTYGLPYIPATAIKGCMRNYYEQEKNDGVEIEKLLGSYDKDGKSSKGCLVFFDTFPEKYTLEFDALTPHNSDYYGMEGEIAPSDSERKIPLMIPCLSKKSKFKIYVACTDGDLWEKHKSTIVCNLKNALREYGLGGKTSYGYGLSK